MLRVLGQFCAVEIQASAEDAPGVYAVIGWLHKIVAAVGQRHYH